VRARGVLVAAIAAAFLVTSAGAAEQRAGIDLTTRAGVDQYLISLGVDPAGVVVQRGKRNYAGPNCPGTSWTCTTARRVIQVAHEDENIFECTPAGPGTSPSTNTCVIVQSSTTGANNARCRMFHTGTAVSQSCSINQTNQSGANNAVVDLVARGRNGAVLTTQQDADVTQANGSGRNDLNSYQKADHSTNLLAGGLQSEEANQTLEVDQTSTTGPNDVQVKQFQFLKGTANVNGAVTQRQNSADAGPDQAADITQNSDSGKNTSLLDQGANLTVQARSRTGPVNQRQGSPTGGMDGHVDQFSSQPSTSTNFQDEDYNANASTPPGTLTQVQFGPMDCCTDQLGNAGNVFDINQESMLFSNGGTQSSEIIGTCVTSGTCTVDQLQRTDNETVMNSDSCTGSVLTPCAVATGITCPPEGECTSGDLGGEPLSSLTKGVCNNSAADGTCGSEIFPYTPVASGFRGDEFEYEFVYENAGTGTAHSVVVSDEIPTAFSFEGCSDECEWNPDTREISWTLGDVEADSSRSMTFLVGTGEFTPFGTHTNVGSYSSEEEEPGSSNMASVSIFD
jgi:uncharacterized repeat protein (TIGR01451 family)